MQTYDLDILYYLAALVFLVAVYYCFKLSQATKNEKYWLCLALGIFVIALHHWMMIPWEYGFLTNNFKYFVAYISSIIGAVLIAYGSYGLYHSIKVINDKLK